MTPQDLMADARATLYGAARVSPASVAYTQAHRIDVHLIAGFCGCVAVLPIWPIPHSMFDLDGAAGGECCEGVVIEAFDRDGETAIDLIAWPMAEPGRVLSMFRRAPLLGLWQALSPFSYSMGRPLDLHRTPLEWLQADCQGAAIVLPAPGVRMLLDAPGLIAARDKAHASALIEMQADLDRMRLVVPRAA